MVFNRHKREHLRKVWRKLTRRKLALIGLVVCVLNLLMALLGDYLLPYNPNELDTHSMFAPPGAAHIMGTDEIGRDVLSRIIYGARISILVGVVSVAIALLIGTSLGLIAGYWRGKTDIFLSGLMDAVWAFPTLILALAITAILGSGIINIMIAIGIVYTPGFFRIVRSQVLYVGKSEYVEGAITIGLSHREIILRYILPNVVSPIIVQASLNVAQAIIAEASLSFLGVGMQPPNASWGYMLKTGFSYLQKAPWLSIYPGLAILLLVLSLNFLGDGLRDALDVKLRDN